MDTTRTTTTAAWQGLAPGCDPGAGRAADPAPQPAETEVSDQAFPVLGPAALPAERALRAAPDHRKPVLWAAAALVAAAAAGAWVVLPLDGGTTQAAPAAQDAPSHGGTPAREDATSATSAVDDAADDSADDTQTLPDSGATIPVVSLTGGAYIVAPSTSAPGRDAGGAPTDYSAANLLDGDPSTCWRMDGDGQGYLLDVFLDGPRTVTRVGLVNGYAKVDPVSGEDRYAQERRITRVTWTVGDQVVVQDLTDGTRSAQTVAVRPTSTDRVSVRIEATTAPGDAAFDKTAISDITLLGT